MPKLPRLAVLAAVLPLAACVPAAPERLVLAADPDVPVRPPRYTAVTAGIARFYVVEPKDWRELNRQVAPRSGSDGPGRSGMEGMPGMGGRRDTGGR